jgi:putative glutamine amidotransferase
MTLIGIVASMTAGRKEGSDCFYVSEDYIAAIVNSGGVPVVLPPVVGPDGIRQHLQCVQGVLLIGGGDVDPAIYGQEPLPLLGPVSPARDSYEIAAVKTAVGVNLPVLAICRGMQLVNVAFGGTLYQDVSLATGPLLQHRQNSPGGVPGHLVQIGAGTLLSEVLGEEAVRANSLHHQAVKEIAPGFVACGRTGDGIIEGIENKGANILGVQWHPEMMAGTVMDRLFKWLITAVGCR